MSLRIKILQSIRTDSLYISTIKAVYLLRQNNKKAIIIGCGIAGPTLAMALRKGGIESTIYESRESPVDHIGLFFYLGTNGVNILKTLGIEDKIRERGHSCKTSIFKNHNGKSIAEVNESQYGKKYGTTSIVIKREAFQKAMREEAESRGIKIEWGKKLANITTNTDNNTVTAHFEDCSEISGDYVIGCDGIHSKTRKIILPDGPEPKYFGNVAAGAITQKNTKQPQNELIFHFGKKAYMIYFVSNENEIMWGAHLNIDEKLLPGIKSIPPKKWQQKISDLFDKDVNYIQDFIQNEDNISRVPLYDIEFLPTWYKGLVCLVGDSAHATTPHAGQGASIAMESAMTLAKCLRDIPETPDAFARYQQLRKDRVEKMIAMARRSGGMFTTTNPIGKVIRNVISPFMIKFAAKGFDDIYGYKIDWDKKIN